MNSQIVKNILYEQVARIGKATSSPKRLELLELLSQGEKTVESLANEIGADVKLTSAHLKALKDARLVSSRRDGKYMIYRISGQDVAALCVNLRQVAEEHLLEARTVLEQMADDPSALTSVNRETLLEDAQRGDIVVIDVRPESEFTEGHLPFARSIPLDELEKRITELPAGRNIVAYCRGPFCVMAGEAVKLLETHGFKARKLRDGINEWQAAGLDIEKRPEGETP